MLVSGMIWVPVPVPVTNVVVDTVAVQEPTFRSSVMVTVPSCPVAVPPGATLDRDTLVGAVIDSNPVAVTITAGLLGAELPSVVMVITVTEYVTPLDSPVIVQVSALGVVQVNARLAPAAGAVYPVSVPVPKLADAVHETTVWLSAVADALALIDVAAA